MADLLPRLDAGLPKLGAANIFSRAARRRKQPLEQKQEPERPSLLGKAMDVGLGGLAIVGNLLDVPGSMVRDTIDRATGGKANPFDQLLTPFSSENRVTGRDLNRKLGLIGRKDTTANWWGGLASEIALDPTTYMTFGASALTKGGQVAKAAGLLDDAARIASTTAGRKVGPRVAGMTGSLNKLIHANPDALGAAQKAAKGLGVSLADVGDKPLRGLVGIGLPFQRPMTVLGSGKTAQKIGGALDKIGMMAKASAPGRLVRGLFDHSVKGRFGKAEQELAEKVSGRADAVRSQAYMDTMEDASRLKESHETLKSLWGDSAKQAFGNEAHERTFEMVERAARLTGEMSTEAAGGADNASKAFDQILPSGLNKPTPESLRQITDTVEGIQKKNLLRNASIESKGGSTGWVPNHLPRSGKRGATDSVKSGQLAPRQHDSMLRRTPETRTIPQEIVNNMAMNPATRAADAALEIEKTYGNYLDPNYGETKDFLGNITSPGSKEKHAKALAQYLQGKDIAPIYSGRLLDDQLNYAIGSGLVDDSLDAIHQTVIENLLPDGGTNLNRMFSEAGMNSGHALTHLAKLTGKSVDELGRMGVPEDVAKAIKSFTEVENNPAWAEAVGGVIDYVNKLFKTSVTMPFPAHHMRNLTGGTAGNLLSGEITNPVEIGQYAKSSAKANRLADKPDPALMSELIAHRVIDPKSLGMGVEATDENIAALTHRMIHGDKLSSPLDYKGSFQEAGQAVAKAGKLGDRAGVLGKAVDKARQGYGTVVATGERVARRIELVNRASMYFYLTDYKGWSPAAAAAKVHELQVDYAKLSPFEKSVMRRLVPFYSWNRKMAPVIFKNLLERPGGAQAQTIRAINRARKPDEVTPDYVAESASIPTEGMPFIGSPPAGTNRYITGFGLPLEAPMQYLGGGFRGAGLEALSQLNPLLKGPLEHFTGQSFFQRDPTGGRPIEDLDPTIGRLISNVRGKERPTYVPRWIETAVANSPLTRFLTSARQATDSKRKNLVARGVNLLTGMKISDVSPQAQDAALQDRANALLKQYPEVREFSNLYVPKDRLLEMSPARREGVETLLSVNRTLAERAKIAAAKKRAEKKQAQKSSR